MVILDPQVKMWRVQNFVILTTYITKRTNPSMTFSPPIFIFFLEKKIIQQEVKRGRGDVVVVSDLERFEKIKEQKKNESVASRRSVVGFRGEETDKCWREVTLSIRCVVVGLDLVKVQILIPILPLWISHLPLPPVFYERRISPRLTRVKKIPQHQNYFKPHLGCGLK